MSIWVPPKAAKELRESSREYEADVMSSLERDAKLAHWERMLHEIDPKLHLVKARNPVKTGTALRPGFWHVIRDNSDKAAPPTVMTIEGPNGEYIEPNSAIFDLLRRNDLQRQGSRHEREERERRIEQQKEREKERELADLTAEAMERWVAGNRAFVSMDRSVPWTQSARARGK